ncbi:hypothetical protein TNCV_494231 [Trichonephila clavipes]|nr:hypothetical protein TNCV_494231 [Trichonephila clavipes]
MAYSDSCPPPITPRSMVLTITRSHTVGIVSLWNNLKDFMHEDIVSIQTDKESGLHSACTLVDTELVHRGYSSFSRRTLTSLDLYGRHFEL